MKTDQQVSSINMEGYSIKELHIGQKASISKTITEADVVIYAGLIADFNPLHMNEEYAKNTRFGSRVVHGMLTASFFSTILGIAIPGKDCIYLSQNVKFLLPVRIGDTITATGEITKIILEKRIGYMRTTVVNQRGEMVIDGEAVFMATKE